MKNRFFCAAMLALALGGVAQAMSPEDRQSYQQMLLLNLPSVPLFDQWILRTKELPPDFDALPRNNALPDPLIFADGKPVKTAADWRARRAEILALYEKYLWGKVPPLPKFDHASVQDVPASGYRTRTGTIFSTAGPGGGGGAPGALGTIRITMQIPDGPGPFPVVLGPGLIGGLGGFGRGPTNAPATGPASATATARGPGRGRGPVASDVIRSHGYIVCNISADDFGDDSIKMAAAIAPDCDPGALPRRGWAASAVVDYLLTLPEVDAKLIAITGYSRDAKSMVIGAALDQRIAAVIAGSPGVGGILPFRLAGEFNQAESLQSTTLMFPDWYHPRARYFVGREDRLPVDGNLLLAAIAPRPFFLVGGLNDEVSNNYGDEQSFHSANQVYKLLGDDAEASGRLGLLKVPGNHGINDWAQAMTWLDSQFGKSDKKWTNQWEFPWDWQQWKARSGETVDLSGYPALHSADMLQGITTAAAWEAKAAAVRKQAAWMLGDSAIANVPFTLPARGPQQDVPNWVITRSIGPQAIQEFGWYADYNSATATRAVTFNGVNGTLYYPKNASPDAKLPTVIWLHSYSYPLGYMWVYHREVHPILALVEAGYAVLAYDQAGFGSRRDEVSSAWLATFPHGSQMGHLVQDARSAVDALSQDAQVNPKSIYLFGYGLGGNVALYTAALEPKVAGVVSISGFTPMRTDTAATGAGGIARYAVDRPLIPRLGFFIGSESKIPYDYDEMIASIAPRPVYVVNPLFDRNANFQDVHQALAAARQVYDLYGADDHLKADEPWDYDRLAGYTQDRIIMWMRENMK